MEDPRSIPTAADYAASGARGAEQAARSAEAETKRLEERVSLLEAKVKGLFLVLNYMLDTDHLNRLSFDEDGNVVVAEDKEEDTNG